VKKHPLGTFFIAPLVHIHQKEKIAPEIALGLQVPQSFFTLYEVHSLKSYSIPLSTTMPIKI
jgi:hypothetical protein